MITEKLLIETLKKSFENNFKMRPMKPNVFQIFLPYYHEDGDMIDIFIQSIGNKVYLTDFGNTMMRLSYYTELNNSARKKIFDSILSSYCVKYSDGKLSVLIDKIENIFGYIMEFIAVVTKISDISYLKHERVKTMFYEYFDNFMIKELSKELKVDVTKDYIIPSDKKGEYSSPYAIIKPKKLPILFFPMLNDDRCKDTIMTLLYYKTSGFENKSVGVFNDFGEVSAKNSGKVMDLLDRPLSSFDSNKSHILEYTKEQL